MKNYNKIKYMIVLCALPIVFSLTGCSAQAPASVKTINEIVSTNKATSKSNKSNARRSANNNASMNIVCVFDKEKRRKRYKLIIASFVDMAEEYYLGDPLIA